MDSNRNNGDEMTDPNDQNKGAIAANANACAPNQQQTAAILKLDIDCFDEVFDYSSREDLLAVGKTCKRLHQVAGYCYKQNYSAFKHDVVKQEEHFTEFIRKIRITPDTLDTFLDSKSKFRLLTQIHFYGFEFTRNDLEQMKEVLSKVEVLQFEQCIVDGCFHETVLAHCTKLKDLCVNNVFCRGNQWLHQKYPTLERFEMGMRHEGDTKVEDIVSFLKQNPNIRKFATYSSISEQTVRLMEDANIELDDLSILISRLSEEEKLSLFRLLNQLHDHGIYKQLELYSRDMIYDEQIINQLVSLNGLVKMNIDLYVHRSTLLPVLENLEELIIYDVRSIPNSMALASGLKNIKRISFNFASVNDILPFISQAANLSKIRIRFITDVIIDLPALNALREKLDEASDLTLYVDEIFYLVTKWAMKGKTFDLVKLKRSESYEWDQVFQTQLPW